MAWRESELRGRKVGPCGFSSSLNPCFHTYIPNSLDSVKAKDIFVFSAIWKITKYEDAG